MSEAVSVGPPYGGPTVEVRVDHYSAVHSAACAAREVALRRGLPGALPDRAAVLASELASNIAKHARNGSVYVQPLPLGAGVEVLAADSGPGMAEPERCMSDGFTTTGTLGTGLGAVRRMADDFLLRSRPGEGTYVSARLTVPGRGEDGAGRAGSVVLPGTGEQACGDASAVAETGGSTTAVVVDGLGHGAAAAQAAGAAVRTFTAAPDRPLAAILTAMNRALRSTRGAAAAVVRAHAGGRLDHCGVGNVRVLAFPGPVPGGDWPGRPRQMVGQPGVVGWNMPAPHARSLDAGTGATVLLHSDGIADRWYHSPVRFALRLPPPLLALRIAHTERRGHDDAAVLTLRIPENDQ